MNVLLDSDDIRPLLRSHPRALVVDAVRRAVDDVRSDPSGVSRASWGELVRDQLERKQRRSLRKVFNATGVVLHTNLGRAPLADSAVDAIRDLASGFTNLEFNLETGNRGSRYVHCVELLRELTGAEDAIVVNNCASALVLALSALARDSEVLVSRGELVEIGGSFRVPDIMQRSGAVLVEVGTTNRTHVEDYRRAISPRTGAIAKVHRSNFTLSGFVAEAGVKALAPIASEHGIPIIHDLGSGLLISLEEYGFSGEPTAREALNAGATIVTMSGDKLLGGPQSGIIVGAKSAIARLRQDPFARAMRVDKMTIAALIATLELYRDPELAVAEIPTLRMLTTPAERLKQRCDVLVKHLQTAGVEASTVESTAAVGAGAFPSYGIPSFSVRIAGDPVVTEDRLRAGDTPVIARIADGAVLLDMRSVPERDDETFQHAVISSLG